MTTDNTSPAMLTVSTVPATTVAAGYLQVTANTRAVTDKATGTKTEIPANQRSRSIIIPEFSIDAPSKFISLITGALHKLAIQQLKETWEADANVQQVTAASYTLDSLLLYAAREAESKKLNADSIMGWWNASQLRVAFVAKYSPAQVKRFELELSNIAAPVLSAQFYNEDKALRRIVTLATYDADAAHPTVIQMIAKLQRYIDRIIAERDAIGSVEEIDG